MRTTREDYDNIINLLNEKKNVTEISRLTGISRSTINVWKNGKEFTPRISDFRDKLSKMSKEELQTLINNSCSISDILKKFNKIESSSFYRKVLNEFITSYNLDLSVMSENKIDRRNIGGPKFTQNSKSNRANLKSWLLRNSSEPTTGSVRPDMVAIYTHLASLKEVAPLCLRQTSRGP